MAKSTAKNTAPTEKKAAPAKSKPKAASSSSSDQLEKVSEEVLKKFKTLDIGQKLQDEIEWCLGSYRHDQNPVGLLDVSTRALALLKEELANKTKGITTKLVSDLEKALKEA